MGRNTNDDLTNGTIIYEPDIEELMPDGNQDPLRTPVVGIIANKAIAAGEWIVSQAYDGVSTKNKLVPSSKKRAGRRGRKATNEPEEDDPTSDTDAPGPSKKRRVTTDEPSTGRGGRHHKRLCNKK